MKTVSTVAAQAMTKVRDGDFIEADTDISVQAQHDQERETGKVINQLFRQLRSIRTAWRQAWPDSRYKWSVESRVCLARSDRPSVSTRSGC